MVKVLLKTLLTLSYCYLAKLIPWPQAVQKAKGGDTVHCRKVNCFGDVGKNVHNMARKTSSPVKGKVGDYSTGEEKGFSWQRGGQRIP